MKRFLFKLSLFAAINVAAYYAMLALAHPFSTPREAGIRSKLPIIDDAKSYDIVLLGSSRGEVLTCHSAAKEALESALGPNVLNLSHQAAGIEPAFIYLSCFYQKGNRTKKIVYLIEPFALYSPKWNRMQWITDREPFRIYFTKTLLTREGSLGERLGDVKTYVTAKLKPQWFLDTWKFNWSPEDSLTERDPQAVNKRIAFLYPDGTDQSNFERYAARLEQIARLATENGATLSFVVMPALLGQEPGIESMNKLLLKFEKKLNTKSYDFSSELQDLALFADHDHLNVKGIERFSREYLAPVLLLH